MNKLFLVIFLLVSQFAQAIVISEETTVTLSGARKHVDRPEDEGYLFDDCGDSYAIFVPAETLMVEVESMESGAKTLEHVTRMSMHGDIYGVGYNGQVTGKVFKITAGKCNTENFGIIISK